MVAEPPLTLQPPTMKIVFEVRFVPPLIVRPPDDPSMQLSFPPLASPQSEFTWTNPPVPAATPGAGKMYTPPDPPPPWRRAAEHRVGFSATRDAEPLGPVSFAATAEVATVIV